MSLLTPVDNPPFPSDLTSIITREADDDIVRQLLRPHFAADRETLIFARFDVFERLICLERVGGDDVGRCVIPPPCWRRLIGGRVATVVLSHNHPSGIARPSDGCVATTRDTAHFLHTIGIDLVDHLIFVASGHFSFRSAEML